MGRPEVNTVDDRRRRVCAGLLAAAVTPAAWAGAEDAAPTWRVADLDWHDAARSRPVPTRLYMPRGGAGTSQLPLVVFSHGIGGWRGNYSYLGRFWAEHGVASLHVQHVGSDRSLWGGNLFSVVGRLRAAAQDSEAIDRVLDLRFALDRLLQGGASDNDLTFDPARIVVAGHSYGANTSLLASGARVQRNGRWLDFHDHRFSAAVIISAPPFYGEPDISAILSRIAIPTLHVTSTEDVIWIPGMHSGVEDRVAVFDAVPDPRKALVMYQGGSHSIFTDRAGPGGPSLNQQVKAATSALTLAFVHQTFGTDTAALATWHRAWRPLVARSAGIRIEASA
jgi:predicted dienelactone hydrolase